ncbi:TRANSMEMBRANE PROTEIN [Salix viminalis]|uniref:TRANSMEMBRANE PROTEIN n=1 Tax=Salix viminalis TaxID=40686 RepID=A0A9Q0SGI7_SALVM|nr:TRANSMEMBRANE PROTEIN [Salix viminalis]
MFESALELIAQAASSSFVVFCFCNLIIVIILMGSRPVSKFDRESENLRSAVINAHARVKEDTLASHDGNEISIDDRKVSIILEEPTGEGGEESGNDNEDDELRRRAEEFISKSESEQYFKALVNESSRQPNGIPGSTLQNYRINNRKQVQHGYKLNQALKRWIKPWKGHNWKSPKGTVDRVSLL